LLTLLLFCYAGRQEQADAVLAALEVLPEPHRSMIRTLVDVCAYAGIIIIITIYSYSKYIKDIKPQTVCHTSFSMQPVPTIGV